MPAPNKAGPDFITVVIRWVGVSIAVAQAVAELFFAAPERPQLFAIAATMMLGSLVREVRK